MCAEKNHKNPGGNKFYLYEGSTLTHSNLSNVEFHDVMGRYTEGPGDRQATTFT
jgi:hypothetical protein